MSRLFERYVVRFSEKWSMTFVRVALAVIYVWFGALKIAAVSPVAGLIQSLYPSLPEPQFLEILGVWEVLIGLGLLTDRFLRPAVILLWLQMAGIMIGPIMKPALFFQTSNPLLLNVEGEFVVKNLVIIAASIALIASPKLMSKTKT